MVLSLDENGGSLRGEVSKEKIVKRDEKLVEKGKLKRKEKKIRKDVIVGTHSQDENKKYRMLIPYTIVALPSYDGEVILFLKEQVRRLKQGNHGKRWAICNQSVNGSKSG